MEFLKVAKILSTVGLKGEVRVYTTSSFKALRYKKNNLLYLVDENNSILKELHIASYRNKEGNIDYLTFKEINSIEEAEKIINKELVVYKDNRSLDKDTYYYSDLISLKVLNKETNEVLGTIIRIDENTPTISLILKLDRNKKEIYIPFNDYFIDSIDLENKRIYLNVIEGLLEI